jgi:hypothetical protein
MTKFYTQDWLGRTVVCEDDVWRHIEQDHPEMKGQDRAVASTVGLTPPEAWLDPLHPDCVNFYARWQHTMQRKRKVFVAVRYRFTGASRTADPRTDPGSKGEVRTSRMADRHLARETIRI